MARWPDGPRDDNTGMAATHRYEVTCEWEGSTGAGYEAYSREHRASVPPRTPSSRSRPTPSLRGDPRLLNPEQLVVLAPRPASCCRSSPWPPAELDVVAYQDRAEGEMPEDDEPMRITTIRLRPEITLARDRQRSGSPSWSTSPTASATWPTACAPMSWSNPRSSSCECGVNHPPRP